MKARNEGDPPVRVGAIFAPDRYVLSPAEEFGGNFALDYDQITSAYDCSGYKVYIEPYDEQAEWRKLSREKFTAAKQDAVRREIREAARPSPEQVFAAAATVEAEAGFTRKLRRKS